MNRRKDSRISKANLINEGLLENERGEEESISEEFVSAPLFSISEAAKSLGIGRKELYRLIEWREINTIKSGNSLRVEGKSLEAFKASGKTISV
ncbi:MAG: helix-turn-helix domain-containing protein [Deltaproteobacteria bacterium]|nr:helix-turn-helix domain-containing protein [Deltaproteobacteria bacterium]